VYPTFKNEESAMQRNRFIPFVLIFFISLSFGTLLFAQSGQVIGFITDAASGKPLGGANVYIDGTGIGAASDLDGDYVILQAPAGVYDIIATYIGYKEKIISVTIEEDKINAVNIELFLDVLEGETIVVTAQAEGQAAAINQQLQSNTIKNVVSSERIMEVPDQNAAESIGRLPGISITRDGGEANKVVIRGLAPTYNTVMIGGEKVPATSLNDRSVDLNMISPTMLSSIEVTKALTSDMDADAFGGTINLILGDAPDGFKYNFRVSAGYNDQRSSWDQYKAFFTLSNRFANDRFGLMVTGDVQRVPRGSDRLNSSYEIIAGTPEGKPPFIAWGPSLYYSDEQRERASFSVFMDYRLPAGGSLKFTNFLTRLDRHEQITRHYYNNDLGYFSPSYRERKRQIDVLSNSLAGEHRLDFGTLDWRVSRTVSTTRHPSDIEYWFTQQDAIDKSQLENLTYTATELINVTTFDPNMTRLFDVDFRWEESHELDYTAQVNFKLPFNLTNSIAGYLKMGGRYLDKTRDRDQTLERADATQIGNDVGLEGGSQIERYHSLYGQPGFNFHRVAGGPPGILNYLDPNYNQEDFLQSRYPFAIGFNIDELDRLQSLYLYDNLGRPRQSSDMNDYEIDERIAAGYIMSEIHLGRMLMVMPGVRYEYTHNYLNGREGIIRTEDDPINLEDPAITDTSAYKWYDNWFPMLQVRVKPLDWFDLRLAYTKSISRPRHAWMLPRESKSAGEASLGNPKLLPQLSTNYDIFLSFYGNRIGLLTLGLFRKDIENLIYKRKDHILLDDAEALKYGLDPALYKGALLDIPENLPFMTKVEGIEFEWQTNFYWLPSPFDGIVLTANYTHLWSETSYPWSTVVETPIDEFPYSIKTLVDTSRVGPMINQPDDVVNVMLGYGKGPFSIRYSVLFQGSTVRTIANRPRNDTYVEELLRMDLAVRFRLTDKLSFFLNFNNITNEPDESYQHADVWGTRYPTYLEYYGWTFDIGIGFNN
jgi:TonB-dependent receptor